MTTATLGFYVGMFGALLLGFVLAAAIGFPIVRAHALAESAETIRVLTNPLLAQPERTDWARPVTPRTSDAVADLPMQFGTLHEHKRRERPGWIEVTDGGPIEDPIGAEPVSESSGDRSGFGVTGRADGPRTSGNAAPTMEIEAPPRSGGPAGPPWPLWWRLAWPVLVFAAMAPVDFWHTPVGERIDRTAVWLGRHERHWCYEAPAARHAAPILGGEAERRRVALLERTQELPLLFSLADVEEIPVARIGDRKRLLEVAT